ncbi:DnaJ C-terminal domain-containing protein [Streptomyces sp. DT20]|uniref:DnaJ C-terminal domain-containing protein n=1 Tax=Streptomyces sp. DT20 TaxID=3416519 RepID=UPI003CED8F3C
MDSSILGGYVGTDRSAVASFNEELARLAEDLRDLRIGVGSPPLRTMVGLASSARPLSVSAISEALNGKRLPRRDFFMELVRVLLTLDGGRPIGHDDDRLKLWRVRWMEVERLRVRVAMPGTKVESPRQTSDVNQIEPAGQKLTISLDSRASDIELLGDQALAGDGPDEGAKVPEPVNAKAQTNRTPVREAIQAYYPRSSKKLPGEDIVLPAQFPLEECAFGVIKELEFPTAALCSACQGSGNEAGKPKRTCKVCRGGGRLRTLKKISVKVPAGVDDGTRIQFADQGEVGPGGGPPGDVYLWVEEIPHRFFCRKGDDLHCTATVSVALAVLGGQMALETLEGEETLAIQPGTQPGKVIKLEGRGVPHLRNGGRGDLFVHFSVQMPTLIDPEERALFLKLANLNQQPEITPWQDESEAYLPKLDLS